VENLSIIVGPAIAGVLLLFSPPAVVFAINAATFGFSRPSYYEAAAAVDRDGLGGLVPAKPGPRRAHKLTGEVIAYARQLREQDPDLGSAQLADAIAAKFAIRVHPRSVERALARAENSKSGDAQ